MPQNYLIIVFYFLAVAILDILAYLRYHKRWLLHERARTVLGVTIVLMPALIFVFIGLLDLLTWLTIFAGFGVAGAITLFLDINIDSAPYSNLDSYFFGEIIAIAMMQQDLCQLIAEMNDQPDVLELVREIFVKSEKLKLLVNDQRKFLKNPENV